MSFFGLTAFGPENSLKSSRVNSIGFTLFSDEDFTQGFNKTTKDKLNLTQVRDFLKNTFNFVPLDDEIKNKSENDNMSIEEVLDTISRIREYLAEISKKSVTYTSFQKYYDDMYKHKRKPVNPSETFKLPVTFSQSYGFHKFTERDLNECKYPKVKCDETKYAESIIMSRQTFTK